MEYQPFQKIWDAKRNAPISDVVLRRLTILVPPHERALRKKCDYEVLVFTTSVEWDNCTTEHSFKRNIVAKFRCYDDAEYYAQSLLLNNIYCHKVLIRS